MGFFTIITKSGRNIPEREATIGNFGGAEGKPAQVGRPQGPASQTQARGDGKQRKDARPQTAGKTFGLSNGCN
jgi:hypothetical protein